MTCFSLHSQTWIFHGSMENHEESSLRMVTKHALKDFTLISVHNNTYSRENLFLMHKSSKLRISKSGGVGWWEWFGLENPQTKDFH